MTDTKFRFDKFVAWGDSSSVTLDGLTFTARIEHDTDSHIDDDDCHKEDPNHDSFKGATAEEYERTQAARKAWLNDEWHYAGVVLSVERDGWTKDHVASLWGIEINYPGGDNAYLAEVAEELVDEWIATEAAEAQKDQDAVYGKTQTHTTVEAFSKATGLSVEMIRAHKITAYNAATGVPLHELKEEK